MDDGRSPMDPHAEPTAGDRIGDYRVVGQVARGGMASVLAVEDLRTRGGPGPGGHRVVALKLLLPLDGSEEAQSRFRREFRSLSRLHHNNVLRVFEWGLLGDRPWFTMELLDGHDLRVEAEQLQSTPVEVRFLRVEAILAQVARALAYVHDRGLVHRDVTPGNIMVVSQPSPNQEPPGSLPDGAVKLMDFGVVKEDGGDMTAVGELVGTVAFMAPEQITGEEIDARTDLYSLGAVLYLLLTGKRPFQAHTIHGFMEKHLHQKPRPPRELVPEIPERLEQICLRLLEKAPAQRFASASHLLHVLGALPPNDEPDGRWPPSTVGRTSIKVRLREAVDEVAAGRTGQAILVSGPSGQGKSRLLELAELQARRLGLPVAVGRCRLQDRPFAPFKSVLHALRTENLPAPLAELFDDPTSSGERYAVLAAFRDLVVARAPAVLILDDTDRADGATIELLTYLIRNTLELASEPVLFLLGHDSGEQRLRSQLESLASVSALEVPALTAAEVEELVVSVLGSTPATLALASRVFTEGHGSPAFITDMLRGLIDDGLIVEDRTGVWRLTVDASEITRSQLPMPASLRQALEERLQPLSADARAIGRIVALARRRVDLDVLLSTSALPEERTMEALDALVDAEIVTETRSDDEDKVELSHGRFREVLLEEVGHDVLRDGHRRLGEALERHHRARMGEVCEELAWHFEQAGLVAKATACLVLAGERHLNRGLYQEAVGLLERALALEPEARAHLLLDDADRRLAEIWLAMSRARHGLGQAEPAVGAVTEAQRIARLVKEPRLMARVAHELGTQLRAQGRAEDAKAQLEAAVEAAMSCGDHTLLPNPLYELGSVAWTRGDLDTAEAHWRRSLQIAQQVGDERSQARGFNGLAILALSRGQQLDARKWLEQAATVFERLGMLSPLVVARANLIELYVNTGVLRKAQSLAERTFAQAEEVGLLEGIALGRGWRARILLLLGRPDEAERDAREALAAVEKRSSVEDLPFVLSNLVDLCFARGRWEEASAWIDRALEAVRAHDHERVLHEVLSWKALASTRAGRPAEGATVLDQAPPRPELWPHVQVRTDLATGRALAALAEVAPDGDARRDAAREHLQRALAVSEANGFRYHQLVAHLTLSTLVDAATRDRHVRVAAGLARSLAANLPADDAQRFLGACGVTG